MQAPHLRKLPAIARLLFPLLPTPIQGAHRLRSAHIWSVA